MSPDDVTLMDFMNFSSKLVGDVVVTVRNADGTPNGYTVTSDGVARGNLPAILPASRQAGNVRSSPFPALTWFLRRSNVHSPTADARMLGAFVANAVARATRRRTRARLSLAVRGANAPSANRTQAARACALRSPALQVLRRQWLQEDPPQPENFDLGHVQIVVRTVETTDVMWKDGTVTYGIPATQLKPAYAVDDFEFWPRMAVTRTKRSLGLATTDAPVRPKAGETKACAAADADS